MKFMIFTMFKITMPTPAGHYCHGNIRVNRNNQELPLQDKHMACDAPFAIDKTLWGPIPSSPIKKLTSTGHGCTVGSPGTPN